MLNKKIYKISKKPSVLINNITINQTGEPFLADLQSARPFQITVQIVTTTNASIGKPISDDKSANVITRNAQSSLKTLPYKILPPKK